MKTKTSHCLKNINQKPLKKRLFLCHKKQNTTYIILRTYIKTKKITKKLDKYMLCVYNTKCSHKYRGMEQLAARRAHNPKVVSSSLTPATIQKNLEILKSQGFYHFILFHHLFYHLNLAFLLLHYRFSLFQNLSLFLHEFF